MTIMNINETYGKPTESTYRTSGMVRLVKVLFSGDIVESWEMPLNAVAEALFGAQNGSEVYSCKILWENVSRGVLDVSGSSLAVEWSSIRKPYDDLGNNLGLG